MMSRYPWWAQPVEYRTGSAGCYWWPRADAIMDSGNEFYAEKDMNQPTPDQARAADMPETNEQLKQQVLEMKLALSQYRKLHSLCKRFINKHKIRSRDDFAPLMDQRFLVQDIAECIGYEP